MGESLDTLSPVFLPDPVNRSHPLNRGLVAWWLAIPGLDGGRQFYDLAGSNHGVLTGGTTWGGTTRPGGYGTLAFDGSTGYVQTSPLGITTNTLTITTWFHSAGAQNPFASLMIMRGATANGLNAGNFVGSNLSYIWNDDSHTYGWDSGLAIPTGRWCFAAMVIEPTQGTLYVGDGGVLTSAVNAWSNPAVAFADGFRIGGDSFSQSSRSWNGSLDDFRIYSRSLSPAEIADSCTLSRLGYPGLLNRLDVAGRVSAAGPSLVPVASADAASAPESAVLAASTADPDASSTLDAGALTLLLADLDAHSALEGAAALGLAAADAAVLDDGTSTILAALSRADAATFTTSTVLVESGGGTPIGITTFASTGIRVGIDPGRSTGVQR